jgi:hypothetical protein
MKSKNIVVSSDVATFLTACLDSISCFRCDKKFRSKESTAFHAQVHRMKISTTLTGGVLCERCSKSFKKWAETNNK